MDEVDAKKQERSKSKMAVTRTSRRLIDATHRDVDVETLKGFIVELEKVYDDFCIITVEYELLVSNEKFVEHRVVNGDDITTYNANVKQTYVEARDVYVKIKAENERSKQNIAMAPLMTALRRDKNRVQDIISAVDDSLSQEAPSSESLQMDKSDMENLLNEMCHKITKLTAIQPDIYPPTSQIASSVMSMAPQQQYPSSTLSYTPPQNPPTSQIASSVMSMAPQQQYPSSTLSFTPPQNPPTSQIASSVMSMAPQQQYPSSTLSFMPPQNPPTSQMASSVMSMAPQQQYPSSTLSFMPHRYPPISQMASSTMIITPQHRGSVCTTPELINPSYSVPIFPRPELNPPLQTGVPLTQSWFYNTIPRSSSVPAYPTTAVPPQESQRPYSTGSPFNNNTNISLKKTSLPTFSGLRKDWPEFKAVWKQLAESVYSNKTALAHGLKRPVKGEASQRIRSVYITRPEAYDTMWRKLEAHYDDASASVQAALAGLQQLKHVESEDYRALLELVDEVEAAYCQLQELNHLSILTMRDVDHISEFLPSHVRVEWIRKYQDMSSAEKVNPFPHFMKFMEREREAVARLAENQPEKKRLPRFERSRVKGQQYQINAASQGGKFYKCAFPAHRKDNTNHKTCECN